MAEEENIASDEPEDTGDDDMAAALAEIAEQEASAAPPEAEVSVEPAPEAAPADEAQHLAAELAAIYDVPVQVSAVLGKANMQVSQLLKLGRGAVVELDRKVGEAIDIYVNNRLVARGEVVVVDDRLGVTMTEIVKAD
jgi:flagellar motor switch protein FliN/FliY